MIKWGKTMREMLGRAWEEAERVGGEWGETVAKEIMGGGNDS